MMAAVQPFLSGAISKTVNLPNESSIDDVRDIYKILEARAQGSRPVPRWVQGLQPLS